MGIIVLPRTVPLSERIVLYRLLSKVAIVNRFRSVEMVHKGLSKCVYFTGLPFCHQSPIPKILNYLSGNQLFSAYFMHIKL